MNTQDTVYFSRRERQERETAARTDDASARRLHLEMANRYHAILDAHDRKTANDPI